VLSVKIAILLIAVVLLSGCESKNSVNALDPAIRQLIENDLNASGYQPAVTPNMVAERVQSIQDFSVVAVNQSVIISGKATSVAQVDDALKIARTLRENNCTSIKINLPDLGFGALSGTAVVNSAGSGRCTLSTSWIDNELVTAESSLKYQAQAIDQVMGGTVTVSFADNGISRCTFDEGCYHIYSTTVTTASFPIEDIEKKKAEYNAQFTSNKVNVSF